MKWPSLEESGSLCICLLTIARNREMQPFCFWLFFVGGRIFRIRAQNLTVPLGSGQTISGTGRVRASILSLCRPLARSEFKLYLFTEVYYITLHASQGLELRTAALVAP